jgi:hypothetical protein
VPAISLSIVRAGDPPPWSDLTEPDRYVAPGASWELAIFERGMQSGKPSVALRVDYTPGGGPVIIFENSMAAWIAATAAMRGAFPEAFADGPLAAPPA